MARPLRIEYPGAVYHVTARGNARAAIFLDDDDRRRFLALLAEAVERRGWACYAYCLMDNHYHLLIETASANLSRGMRHLNGVYTQRFNRAHGRVGHVFQGRYKAILVEKQAYLLELCRYVVLNPVRAGMVTGAGDWVWSSYRETVGARVARRDALVPLSKAWLLAQFADDEHAARAAYRRFVRAGVAVPDRPWDDLRAGLVLGGEGFLASVREHLTDAPTETPNPQRHLVRPPLSELAAMGGDRGAWMTEAHDHGYTLTEIAGAAGLHYSSVSKIIKAWRERGNSYFKT
jgi:putative transposase